MNGFPKGGLDPGGLFDVALGAGQPAGRDNCVAWLFPC